MSTNANAWLHIIEPLLRGLGKLGKIGLLLMIALFVVCSFLVHLGNDPHETVQLIEIVGPVMFWTALAAVLSDLASSMMRVQLRQIKARKIQK